MNPSPAKRLRHVIIGVGASVLSMHRPALQLDTVELVGASDVDQARGQARAQELGCPFYADYRRMLAETRPDVGVIVTPHPFHAPIAIDCLQAGCHVLVEKPMAVHVAEADAMIEAAQRAGRLLAVNFQQRLRPEVRAVRALIDEGRLGQVQYLHMVATWTRTAIYYAVAPWRGTWAGEGGGVLLNQAPHNLDMVCYLLGSPARVAAWTRTRCHRIETEDTAQAMLEWPGGALGTLHVSTAEAGLGQRLDIVGTRGALQLGRGGPSFEQLEDDVREHIARCPDPFQAPSQAPVAVPVAPGTGDHAAIYRNLHQAILEGTPLAADGQEGRRSLELANAMIYSSHTGQPVELPLDRARYAALLEDLKARAAGRR